MQHAPSDHRWLYQLCHEHWRRVCRRELVPFAIHALASKDETPAHGWIHGLPDTMIV